MMELDCSSVAKAVVDICKRKLRGTVMRADKRKRLEAKGWKVGSIQEFLNLSSEEVTNIEIKLRLGDTLREQRRIRKPQPGST